MEKTGIIQGTDRRRRSPSSTDETHFARLVAHIDEQRPHGPNSRGLLVLLPSQSVLEEVEYRLLEAAVPIAGVYLTTPAIAIERILAARGEHARPRIGRALLEDWIATEIRTQRRELRPAKIRDELAYLERHASARRQLLNTLLGLRRIEAAYGSTFAGESSRAAVYLSFLPALAQALENSTCDDDASRLSRAMRLLGERASSWPADTRWIAFCGHRFEDPDQVGLIRAAIDADIEVEVRLATRATPDRDESTSRPRAVLTTQTREPDANLRTFHAQGTEPELAEACARARELIHNGTPAHRIALVPANKRVYDSLLATTAKREGMPLANPPLRSALRTPVTRLVRDLLELIGHDAPRKTFVSALRNPSLRSTALKARFPLSTVGRFDAQSRQSGWYRGLSELAALLASEAPPDGAPDAVRRSWDAIAKFCDELVQLRRTLSRARSNQQQVDLLSKALDSWLTLADDETTEVRTPTIPVRATLANLVLRDSLDLEPVPLAELAQVFETHVPPDPAPRDIGGVAWLDLSEIHGRDFDAVFLLGFERNAFPPPTGDHPHLTHADLEKLRSTLDRARNRLPEEMRDHIRPSPPLPTENAWAAVDALRDLLVDTHELVTVSYCRADELGKPKSPSPWIGAIAEAVGRPRQLSELFASDDDPRGMDHRSVPWDPTHRAEYRCDEFRLPSDEDVLAHASLRGGHKALATATEHLRPENATIIRRAAEWIAQVDRFEASTKQAFDPIALGTTKLTADGIGISAIGRLANCPLQFYFHHVLGARALLNEPNFETNSALEIGNAAHDLLERVYERIFREDVAVEERIERARTLIEREFDTREAKFIAPLERHLIKLGQRRRASWIEALKSFTEADLRDLERRGLRPAEFELEVEAELEFDGASTPVKVKGQVDRIDRPVAESETTRSRIVDYKTGGAVRRDAPAISVEDAVERGDLQLPLYSLIFERTENSIPQAALLGVAPRHFADFGGALPERRLDDSMWKEASRAALQARLASLTHLLVQGHYVATPKTPFPCRWCDYQAACPRHHPPSCDRLGIPRN